MILIEGNCRRRTDRNQRSEKQLDSLKLKPDVTGTMKQKHSNLHTLTLHAKTMRAEETHKRRNGNLTQLFLR